MCTLDFLCKRGRRGRIRLTHRVTQGTKIRFRIVSISFVKRLKGGSLASASVRVSRRGPGSSFPGAFIPKEGLFFLDVTTICTHRGNVRRVIAKMSRASFDKCPSYQSSFVGSLGIALGLTVRRRFIVRAPLV